MKKSKLLQMNNVCIVVDDLKAALAFFAELGLELEGETTVESLKTWEKSYLLGSAEP